MSHLEYHLLDVFTDVRAMLNEPSAAESIDDVRLRSGILLQTVEHPHVLRLRERFFLPEGGESENAAKEGQEKGESHHNY